MFDSGSPLLTLGIIAMSLLALALLFVFGKVIWLEYFGSDSGES